VHGCARELASLLDAITTLARERPGKRRLVYLGDIIDRGPDTIGALKLWAEDAASRGVDRIDRVMGNHEMIMLLPLGWLAAIRAPRSARRSPSRRLAKR